MKPVAPAIEVTDLKKRYFLGEIDIRLLARRVRSLISRWGPGPVLPSAEEFWALNGVSFSIQRGESVGIIGSNGAGKSTLLKILSRITKPTEGRAVLYGRIGSLLEVGTGFNTEMTGRENVFLNGSILGLRREEIESRFDQIVDFAGVREFIDTPVKRYSSGMRVRLAFAVASHVELDILLLDEVLAVGDITFRRKCFDRMQTLMEQGRTVLFVSHDLASTIRFCSRVIWIEKGRVVFDGPAEEGCDLYRIEKMKVGEGFEGLPDESGRNVFPAERPFPEGVPRWHFVSLTVRGGDGAPIRKLKVGGEYLFDVEIDAPDPAAVTAPRYMVLAFNDEHGRRVFAYRSDISGIPSEKMPQKGTIRLHIPKLPLLPGNYSVFLRLSSKDQTTDIIQSAAQIYVDDGNFYPTGLTPRRGLTPLCVDGTAYVLTHPETNHPL